MTPTINRAYYRRYCCVMSCQNTSHSKPDFTFFNLPADEERRKQWLLLIGREDMIELLSDYRYYYVCEEHFSLDNIKQTDLRRGLFTNALPSLCLPIQIDVNEDLAEITNSSTQTDENPIKVEIDAQEVNANTLVTPSTSQILTDQSSRSDFEIDCRLTRVELTNLIKCAEKISSAKRTMNRYDGYRRFCLNLFYESSQGYRLLQSALHLPHLTTLYKRLQITTEINDRLLSALRMKIYFMTNEEKPCMAVIDSMPLTQNLSYNNKLDKIVGFHEINGIQTAVAADRVLVMILHGIYVKWQQPIGYAFFPNIPANGRIAQWINQLITKLCDMGLDFRMLSFASDMEADFFENRWVSVDSPYFFMHHRKIYYISDPEMLLNALRNDLSLYDIHYCNGRVAKFEHIVSFYNKDKDSQYRLAPNLTENHLYPENSDENDASQLFNKTVASGISAYINHKQIDESAKDTVEWIDKISSLFSLFNSSNNVKQSNRVFNGDASHIIFLKSMKNLFLELKLIDKKNNEDVTDKAKFVRGFLMNINSYLQLSEEFGMKKCSKAKRILNQGLTKGFFDQIRSKSAIKPTAEQFGAAFRQLFILKAIQPLRIYNPDIVTERFLDATKRGIVRETYAKLSKYMHELQDVPLIPCKDDKSTNEGIIIHASDYNHINSAERHTLMYISGYLLKKCKENHRNCEIFQKFSDGTGDNYTLNHISRYLQYSEKHQICLMAVPCNKFVTIVENLEDAFRKTFKKVHINGRIEQTLMVEMMQVKNTNIGMTPCRCFPWVYFIRLFIKIRIGYTLHLNNREIGRNRKSFVIPLLLSESRFLKL